MLAMGEGVIQTGACLEVSGRRFTTAAVAGDLATWQETLAAAHRDHVSPRCLCTPAGAPMVVYRREIYHVRRMPNGGPSHGPGCRSHALLDELDPPEEDTSLYYPKTRYVRLAPASAAVELGARASGSGHRRDAAPIADILRLLWKRAGLCRWSTGWRPRPWRAVARSLHTAAQALKVGDEAVANRLVTLAAEGETAPLASRAETSLRMRRSIVFAIAPIAAVRQTTRDILVAPWGTERVWCEDSSILSAYNDAASRSKACEGGYVVGMLALYFDRSWRSLDWSFLSVTHAWHPYVEAPQSKLYEQLVGAHRRFSIPSSKPGETKAPWAVLWDCIGGPRAIVPDSEESPHTIHSPWRWRPEGALPRAVPPSTLPS